MEDLSCAKLQSEYRRFAKRSSGRRDPLPCLSLAYFYAANRKGCRWSRAERVKKQAAKFRVRCGRRR